MATKVFTNDTNHYQYGCQPRLQKLLKVAVLSVGGAVWCCAFVDRSTVTAARAKPPTGKVRRFPVRIKACRQKPSSVFNLVALYVAC
ncbi:hypothetical protein, partial [Lacticaseibacillus pantheris]|uniref:hypothetical protein n=1 Tax=Lacticaseibacillus pantheris TaxID=171523 RepID=UPI001F2083E0